ncbi:MAG: C-type lectin domain-containing protein, partial [Planctomycetes bacterium]|nr:C-type lectin domain-containing protein [Planctomycetota bacterium]
MILFKKRKIVDDSVYWEKAFSQRMPGNGKAALRPDTVEFGGHRYWVSDKNLVWHDAQAACKKMGGHLVCIETAEEQEFLEKITVPSKGAKRRAYWIGLKKQDGKLVWVNGQRPRFFAWDYSDQGKREFESELKRKINKYPGITLGRYTGKWRFRDSLEFHYYFICEWDK